MTKKIILLGATSTQLSIVQQIKRMDDQTLTKM